jgi:transposase
VSARTLLRLLRDTPLPEVGPVRVLGVDDWSRRRGRAFGTILVDLEAHRVLELLPDRTEATLAAWLRPHPSLPVRGSSPRQTTGILLREPAALADEEWAYVTHLRQACPARVRLQALASRSHDLVREHNVAALARWLEAADRSETPELRGFADGLRADRAAVEAGPTLPRSRGHVEGQVNRPKTLKRAGYGRSSLELLRLRLLRGA